jgi:phage-related protein
MDTPKPVEWIASSRDDLREFPKDVRRVMGQAIDDAEHGAEHPSAKALKGFGGRGVLEIVDDFDGETYRAVYTVKFAGVIYVLHAFQKKSKKGIATPKAGYRLDQSSPEASRRALQRKLYDRSKT